MADYYVTSPADPQGEKLDVRMWAFNDDSDRDRLLTLLVVKALDAGTITSEDLVEAGYLTKAQKLEKR